MALLRLTHVGLCVSNLERSLRFYCDGLGFEKISELQMSGEPAATLLQLPDVELHAVYLERDGFRVELLHYKKPGESRSVTPRPLNARGLSHLSLRVDDFAATLEALRRNGAELLEASRIEMPDFGAAAIFITDPDGTLIELVQAPGDPKVPPGAG